MKTARLRLADTGGRERPTRAAGLLARGVASRRAQPCLTMLIRRGVAAKQSRPAQNAFAPAPAEPRFRHGASARGSAGTETLGCQRGLRGPKCRCSARRSPGIRRRATARSSPPDFSTRRPWCESFATPRSGSSRRGQDQVVQPICPPVVCGPAVLAGAALAQIGRPPLPLGHGPAAQKMAAIVLFVK